MKNTIFIIIVILLIGCGINCTNSNLLTIPFEQISNRYSEIIIGLVLKNGTHMEFSEDSCIYILANSTFSIRSSNDEKSFNINEVKLVHIKHNNQTGPPIVMSALDFKDTQFLRKNTEKKYQIQSVITKSKDKINFKFPYGKIDYENKVVSGPVDSLNNFVISFDDILEIRANKLHNTLGFLRLIAASLIVYLIIYGLQEYDGPL